MLSPDQLSLPLRPVREGATVMPFAVSPRKARRMVRRELAKLDLAPSQLPAAARLIEQQALLNQVRAKARKEAFTAAGGRMSKRGWFAYVCKPEGRRVVRVMNRLSQQIASEESRLCG